MTSEERALAQFEELDRCVYFDNETARVSSDEMGIMRCHCNVDENVDAAAQACGEDANCINRQLFVECPRGKCHTGDACQNQRLQRKQYAQTEIFDAGKKGFGLRLRAPVRQGDLILEYIGEVVPGSEFEKRMDKYAKMKLPHFFGMAVTADAFIDATLRGGRARFINHSCDPNCSVTRWNVGVRYKMAITADKNIAQGEELSFNYNTDRLGAEPQECLCGAPNCRKVLGGKSLEEERDALVRHIRPLTAREIPRVFSLLVDEGNEPDITYRLLLRIDSTQDDDSLRLLSSLRGYELLNQIFSRYTGTAHPDIIETALRIVSAWPLKTRNKLEASGIDATISCIAEGADTPSELATRAKDLIAHWATLDKGYRIPKMKRTLDENAPESAAKTAKTQDNEQDGGATNGHRHPQAAHPPPQQRKSLTLTELNNMYKNEQAQRTRILEDAKRKDAADTPKKPAAPAPPPSRAPVDLEQLILEATRELEAAEAPEIQAVPDVPRSSSSSSGAPPKKKASRSKASPDAKKEARLRALVSSLVVRSLSKYQEHLSYEQFKRRAKELTVLIIDKEKSKGYFAKNDYHDLDDSKKRKLKIFARDWIHKLLERKGHNLSKHTNGNGNAATGGADVLALLGDLADPTDAV